MIQKFSAFIVVLLLFHPPVSAQSSPVFLGETWKKWYATMAMAQSAGGTIAVLIDQSDSLKQRWTLALSEDNGKTFTTSPVIIEPKAPREDMINMIYDSNETLWLLWDWGREESPIYLALSYMQKGKSTFSDPVFVTDQIGWYDQYLRMVQGGGKIFLSFLFHEPVFFSVDINNPDKHNFVHFKVPLLENSWIDDRDLYFMNDSIYYFYQMEHFNQNHESVNQIVYTKIDTNLTSISDTVHILNKYTGLSYFLLSFYKDTVFYFIENYNYASLDWERFNGYLTGELKPIGWQNLLWKNAPWFNRPENLIYFPQRKILFNFIEDNNSYFGYDFLNDTPTDTFKLPTGAHSLTLNKTNQFVNYFRRTIRLNDGSLGVCYMDEEKAWFYKTNDFVTAISNPLTNKFPTTTALRPAYPNPFNPTTTIPFDVVQPAHLKIEIYDIQGKRITTLINKYFITGTYTVKWDGKNAVHRDVASGIYLVKMNNGKIVHSQKILFIK